jgi:hypothetical protein
VRQLRVLGDLDHGVITLQIGGPSSHQRGRPTETTFRQEEMSGRKSHKDARYQD